MKSLPQLFANNENWRHDIEKAHPGFFKALGEQQSPEFLWIGCADSRVPANEVVGLMPGELFVHRNVANLVNHTDLNLLSVLQFAVDVLKVKHIMVVGHYGCGGVKASMEDAPHGLIDNWLRQVRELYLRNRRALKELGDPKAQLDRMCELNVARQVINVSNTTVVQEAWRRDQPLTIHGWIYGIGDGRLQDLDIMVENNGQLRELENNEYGNYDG
ncbi:carbonic anhydrase [Alcanivorax hongdengensis A-11-3]|uniref:Carbonic anhydrase n=1 Tax=Alcanivorax hongdengensis A-11-3 TaxID=1177179 RepID=L0WF85_9GAMM|nr:carbonate dehydratase [Alcanivorax hongdengensis]EKF75498.1 carbonic anhydrase [Alcanivorax hongdengensis A-11-3]